MITQRITTRAILPSSTSTSIWIVMLCLLLSGIAPAPCAAGAGAGARAAARPQTAGDQETPAVHLRSYVERLPAGSRVKVRLKSGESFKAILMGTSDDDVILKPRTRRPKPERRVALTEIEFIEPEPTGQGTTARVVGITVAVAAATVAGVLLLLTALYSD
jgi:hypothetical protein